MAVSSIPKGYHPVTVTTDKDCWLCLDSMQNYENIIAHDTAPSCLDRLLRKKPVNYGDCHSMHFNCMKEYAKKYDKCGVCKEPIQSIEPRPPRRPIFFTKNMSLPFYSLSAVTPIVECIIGRATIASGIGCGLISALAQKHFGINGSVMAVGLVSALKHEGREDAVINACAGVAIGILGAPFKKQESVMFGGLLVAMTVLSYGGEPELAILGATLTSVVIKGSTDLFWKIKRVAFRSIYG